MKTVGIYKIVTLSIFFLMLPGALFAQSVVPEPVAQKPASVRFIFDHPRLKPTHYEITVSASSGDAAYLSQMDASDDDPYRKTFSISEPTRARIFALISSINNLKGDFDFTKHRVAFNGKKTLIYSDSSQQNTTTYIWSENTAITELTAIFQGISYTLEHGQRLRFLRRFDRLGANAELTQIEEEARKGSLKELHLIADELGAAANDRNIVSVARERAQRLLLLAGEHNP